MATQIYPTTLDAEGSDPRAGRPDLDAEGADLDAGGPDLQAGLWRCRRIALSLGRPVARGGRDVL